MDPEKAATRSATIPLQTPTSQEALNPHLPAASSSSDGATITVPRTGDFTETNSTSTGSRLGGPSFSCSEKFQEYQNSSGIGSRGSDGTGNAATAETVAGTGVASGAATAPHAVVPEGQQEGLSPKRKVIIVLALCICVFLAALDQTIITTALPIIAAQFNSATGYTWIGSSYLLTSAAFLPAWGKLSDIWGRKPVLLFAAIIFLIGSILCAAAQNLEMLLVGRVVQGLGAGGQLGLVNVTISDLIAVRERGLYLSYIGLTWAFASAIGPVLGGVFTEKVTWRLCFWINVPIAVVAMVGLICFLHLESPKITMKEGLKRVDWLGITLVASGTVLFLLGLELGGVSHPWDSPIVICFILFGLLILCSFVYVEWKVAKLPIMPTKLFTNRTNACAYVVGFFHGFIFIAGCYFLPLYFQAVRGATALMAGVYVLPYVMVLSGFSALGGVVIAKTGRYQEVVWAAVAAMTLGAGLIIDLDRTSGWDKIVIYQIIGGMGCGPLFQSPLIAIQANIDHRDVGTATVAFAFLRTLGTALAICIGLVVFQNSMQSQSHNLASQLPGEVLDAISGHSAASSVGFVQTLQPAERVVARDAYAQGLSTMWYFFLAVSAGEFFAARQGSEEKGWEGRRGGVNLGLGRFFALPCYIRLASFFIFFIFFQFTCLRVYIYTRMVDWTGLGWAGLG
ncbi:major facilitator superfamily domain-containing protein [Tuber borchii]|uniref:Efflux pump dotC n=1 Tax=Tuber borchii TaxID=42251 RepID=A0A2T7A465_TUBBO|nr:major facilitator superfamily domain-containing protein [Tuber borchii]